MDDGKIKALIKVLSRFESPQKLKDIKNVLEDPEEKGIFLDALKKGFLKINPPLKGTISLGDTAITDDIISILTQEQLEIYLRRLLKGKGGDIYEIYMPKEGWEFYYRYIQDIRAEKC